MMRLGRSLFLFCLPIGLFLHAKTAVPSAVFKPSNLGAKIDAWRRLAWSDEHGNVTVGGFRRAIQQKKALANKQASQGPQWVTQGPTDLAGRTCCLAISPTSPLTMWMGSAGGGVWRTYDGGSTWTPVGDQLASLAVNALALDPNSTNTLYAGTGEGYYTSDAIGGFGIFRSTDGGTTWAQLPSTAVFTHVNRIAVDPANSSIILASVQPGGIYRSADKGATWTQVLRAQSGQALAFSPSKPTRVIGTVLDYNAAAGQWFNYAVASNDSGQTWTKAAGGLNALLGKGRIETTPLVKDANTVYGAATDGNVWKSVDGGASYTVVTNAGNTGASLASNAIWVDPTNASRIVVGGDNAYESTDGGVTLNQISDGTVQSIQPHPGINWIGATSAYDGVTNKAVYVCTNGGVFEAPDITTASTGLGWVPHFQGAVTSQFYSVAGDGTSGLIIGGLQDNGTQAMYANLLISNNITNNLSNEGGFVAIDPTNASNLYGELGGLQVFQSTDGGLDVQAITSGLTDASTNDCNPVAPLIIDPNNPHVLLGGGASLWKCGNAGSTNPTWKSIRAPGSALISAIAVAPSNSDLIWVGQNDGTIAMTTNGTASNPTWATISGPGTSSPIPNRYIGRILVDPSSSNVVYVCLGGFTSNNLWETTDGGSTWTSITGTSGAALPQVPIRAIARNPGSPNSLYVGTEVGVFSTTNGGMTWTLSSDLDVNVSVDELTYMNHSESLLAATHGRGIWMLPAVATTISNLALSPSSVQGGSAAQATVTLSQVATGSGDSVSLSSNSLDAQVPATVIVAPGQSSATFSITTKGVASAETVTISASFAASQKSALLSINPAVLTGVSVTPTPIVGGNQATGSVTISVAAPSSGINVQLSSNLGQASVPSSVLIAGGAKTASFPVKTSGVAVSTSVKLTASLGPNSFSTNLTLLPAGLQQLTLNPTSVPGGTTSIGTVTLNGDAPFQGLTVKLASSEKTASVPASVTVAGGADSATFAVQTSVVTKSSSAVIKASQSDTTQVALLQIQPAGLMSLSLNQSTVIGGSSSPVVGTVTLTGPAPPAGITLALSSSNTKAATTPSSITVGSGKTSATFTVTALATTSTKSVVIKAISGNSVQSVSLTINPFSIDSLVLSPPAISGGSIAAGIVSLNAPVGTHSAPIAVKLLSSSASVRVPVSVSVLAGSSVAKFSLATSPVGSLQSSTVTAMLGSSSQQATLSVLPPSLASITVNPTTLKGSASASVTGTVTLTSVAQASGVTVSLSSSNSSAVLPPGSVTVLGGKLSATFKIRCLAVKAKTTATVLAALGAATKSASITVTP